MVVNVLHKIYPGILALALALVGEETSPLRVVGRGIAVFQYLA